MSQAEQTLHAKLVGQHTHTDTQLWMRSIVFSICVSLFIGIYYFIQRDFISIETINVIIADVSFILIGLSFGLSSVCYFWNFADQYIVYRKHIGLTGFVYAWLHLTLSFLIYPAFLRFSQYSISDIFYLKFFYGVIAFIIFTVMAIISNRFAVHELGGVMWRRLLRVGYIGYIFVLFHFVPIFWLIWIKWAMQLSTYPRLPPFNLFLFFFGLLVLILRAALFITTLHLFNQHSPDNK